MNLTIETPLTVQSSSRFAFLSSSRFALLSSSRFALEPQGPFSLREAALFGFGQRHEDAFDGWMRLSFCLDGYDAAVGVALRQDARGVVHGEIAIGRAHAAEPGAIAAQVARVLSLDVDARSFVALGERDPVLARLLAVAPGLRPPLFHSPYEAALWSVLSARRPWRVGQQWRSKLAQAAGTRFELQGRTSWSVPLPQRIDELGAAAIARICGIEAQRAERIVAVASAAVAGELDATQLAQLARSDVARARALLKTLPGIGPFYADLILIRATGLTDLLPANEPRFLALLGTLYGLGAPATPEQAEQLARCWSPWRTWAAVLVRAAGPRVLGSKR
ncbi:MAG TPA: hypothetical protein VK509_10530 [Polyangiales bacterium]|nr:hypothetical protein [Polyangiales bacterium]